MQLFVQLCCELDQRNDLGYKLEGKDFLKQHFVAIFFLNPHFTDLAYSVDLRIAQLQQ